MMKCRDIIVSHLAHFNQIWIGGIATPAIGITLKTGSCTNVKDKEWEDVGVPPFTHFNRPQIEGDAVYLSLQYIVLYSLVQKCLSELADMEHTLSSIPFQPYTSLLSVLYAPVTYCTVPVIPRVQFAAAVNRFYNL